MRDEFEIWIMKRAAGRNVLVQNEDGTYVTPQVQTAWITWQAGWRAGARFEREAKDNWSER